MTELIDKKRVITQGAITLGSLALGGLFTLTAKGSGFRAAFDPFHWKPAILACLFTMGIIAAFGAAGVLTTFPRRPRPKNWLMLLGTLLLLTFCVTVYAGLTGIRIR